MAKYGNVEQLAHEAKKRKLRKKGQFWHKIPKDQREGDIYETLMHLEPRVSDPLPGEFRALVRDLHRQGIPTSKIDDIAVDLYQRGRMTPFRMYLSD